MLRSGSFFILGLGVLVLGGCGRSSSLTPAPVIPKSPSSIPTSTPTRSPTDTKPVTQGDESENSVVAPDRKTGGEFTRATDMYGAAVVSEGEYFIDTHVRPWGGSWFPMSDNDLFHGPDSPLQKYDLYNLKVHHQTTNASQYEESHFYHPDSVPWEGRCDAWALASLMEPEPVLKSPVSLDNILFSTSDLKALVTLTYENMEGIIQFGQRFNGDYLSVPEDIYPDQFHRFLQIELFKKRKPFIMDKDPGIEVWNTPVYKADLTLLNDSNNPHLIHVHAALEGMNPADVSAHSGHEADNIVNILEKHAVVFEYDYDLFGNRQSDGSLKVVYGTWLGSSLESHPDFVWALPDSRDRRWSDNSEISVPRVKEIIERVKSAQQPH